LYEKNHESFIGDDSRLQPEQEKTCIKNPAPGLRYRMTSKTPNMAVGFGGRIDTANSARCGNFNFLFFNRPFYREMYRYFMN